MKYLYSLIILVFLSSLNGQDTFSIVAADSATGEIGAAGATCIDGAAQIGGVQIISQIIPGRGGINAQAWICIPNVNLTNGIEQMGAGLNPDEVITWLTENDACNAQGFNPNYRQYGVVDFDADMNVRTATYTGSQADDYKGGVAGVNYAIQGNILLGPEIIEGIEAGFNSVEGSLASKLMAAMQGANVPGADSRCLGRGTSSTTAFLKVYKPDDDVNNPFLNLNILEMPFGQEPIDSLQTLFDTWVQTTSTNDQDKAVQVLVYPNPATKSIHVSFDKLGYQRYAILDVKGNELKAGSISSIMLDLDVSDLNQGVYLLSVQHESGEQIVQRFYKER